MQQRKRIPPEERFWAKVNMDGPVSVIRPDLGPCWIWLGGVTKAGYGNFCIERDGHGGHQTQELAHIYAYKQMVGEIPDGMQHDHLCEVRICACPDHIVPATARRNTLRANTITGINSRKTHCLRGHPLSGDNLRIMKDGERDCKECSRQWAAEYRRRKKLLT